MGDANELDTLLANLENLKRHVDPCACGDCKPITDAAAAIRRLREAGMIALGAFDALAVLGTDRQLPGFRRCHASLLSALGGHPMPPKATRQAGGA